MTVAFPQFHDEILFTGLYKQQSLLEAHCSSLSCRDEFSINQSVLDLHKEIQSLRGSYHSRSLLHSDSSHDESLGSNAVRVLKKSCVLYKAVIFQNNLFVQLYGTKKLPLKVKGVYPILLRERREIQILFRAQVNPLKTALSTWVLIAFPRLLDLTASAHSL